MDKGNKKNVTKQTRLTGKQMFYHRCNHCRNLLVILWAHSFCQGRIRCKCMQALSLKIERHNWMMECSHLLHPSASPTPSAPSGQIHFISHSNSNSIAAQYIFLWNVSNLITISSSSFSGARTNVSSLLFKTAFKVNCNLETRPRCGDDGIYYRRH